MITMSLMPPWDAMVLQWSPEWTTQELILFGIIAGLMLGGPLITFGFTKQHRWLAILALNVCYLVAFLVGGWPAAIIAVVASVMAIVVSAALLRHVFAESTWQAFRYEVELALGRTKGFQIIEDGKSILPPGDGPVLGPRMVVVKPNNAVILERGSRQTQISGPAMVQTEPFEYVRRVFDLRPRQERLVVRRINTPDMLAVDVALAVTYRIDIPDVMRLGEQAFGDREKQIIQDIDLHVPQWEQATQDVVRGFVSQVVGSLTMLEMLRPSEAQRFEQRIRRLSDDRCNQAWHVRVDSVILESVQAVAEAAAHMNERAKAAAQRDALRLMAEGYQLARARGMTDEEIQSEVLRHTLEQIAKDSSTELFFTPELQDLASMLRQGRNGPASPQGSKR